MKREQSNTSQNSNQSEVYPEHLSLEDCQRLYNAQQIRTSTSSSSKRTPSITIARGKLRCLPGNNDQIPAFVADDRGRFDLDLLIPSKFERNRALHGDTVYCQVLGPVLNSDNNNDNTNTDSPQQELESAIQNLQLDDDHDDDEAGDEILLSTNNNNDDNDEEQWALDNQNLDAIREENERPTWQADDTQMALWNPQVTIPLTVKTKSADTSSAPEDQGDDHQQTPLNDKGKVQYQARVIAIVPPVLYGSEIHGDKENAAQEQQAPERVIVGSLKVLASGTTLLTPLNKCWPQFKCPLNFAKKIKEQEQKRSKAHNNDQQQHEDDDSLERSLYQAKYIYGSWEPTHKWPPCISVQHMGQSCLVEDEIRALLMENQVDHGDHPPSVLKDVDRAVHSGLFQQDGETGWKPTPDMYKGRRDYRTQRIFTIDPTTAKDLDDALHITDLGNGQVECGVHIADVSYFVQPGSPTDREAQRRSTTVYLVDRTIPMLPRPLCEVACSLNENVERLAFSCVWKMNMDGTMVKNAPIWYGRTVIRSCARLDYSTAQNIIDGKAGDCRGSIAEEVWPTSRRPTGGHTLKQVADDVLLLHKVAMARRKLRFDNGALALNGIKLTFKLDQDGQTPLLAAPYPIRDSNRLVEEYMLLANYLVAQRLITHAKGRAVLRHHPEPLEEGLDKVAAVAKASMDFEIDITTSQTLHDSLHRLRQELDRRPDADPLVLQAVTQMLMTPMQPADYFAAGMVEPELWKHFALNIPYYTHFTSPIRRYPDVMVHRLLQATLDDKVKNYPLKSSEIQTICEHCNDKRMASKTAQERCDRVFLALYVRAHPMKGEMGLVLSVGVSSFTVYVPSLGASVLLYLEEHTDELEYADATNVDEGTHTGITAMSSSSSSPEEEARKIRLTSTRRENGWNVLEIAVFVKIMVTVYCRDKPPIDVKLRLEGPWKGD